MLQYAPRSYMWTLRARWQVRQIPRAPTSMFLSANSALGPPYHVLVDTNFINFSIQVPGCTHHTSRLPIALAAHGPARPVLQLFLMARG
jgi:hypothetical protein